MGRRQQWVYHVEQSQFPSDFPERLESFKDACGLTWRGLARRLKVSARCVRRWRTGTKPDTGHFYHLLVLASQLGLLNYLLPACGDSISSDQALSGYSPRQTNAQEEFTLISRPVSHSGPRPP